MVSTVKSFVILSTLGLAGCSTVGDMADEADLGERMRPSNVSVKFTTADLMKSVASPLYDLNILKIKMPAELPTEEELYTLPEDGSCVSIQVGIDELSDALGEDPAFSDIGVQKASYKVTLDVGKEMGDEISSLVPYSNYIRKISGAHKAEKRREAAVFRGHLQRAYLHGKAAEMMCPIKQAPKQRKPIVAVNWDASRDLTTTRLTTPIYPKACQSVHDGAETVSLKYDIDANGRPKNVTVAQSTENCFNRASVDAAKSWRFEPVVLDGTPRYVAGNITSVTYMQGDESPRMASYVAEYDVRMARGERPANDKSIMMASAEPAPYTYNASYETASYEIEPASSAVEAVSFASAHEEDVFLEGRDYRIDANGEVVLLREQKAEPVFASFERAPAAISAPRSASTDYSIELSSNSRVFTKAIPLPRIKPQLALPGEYVEDVTPAEPATDEGLVMGAVEDEAVEEKQAAVETEAEAKPVKVASVAKPLFAKTPSFDYRASARYRVRSIVDYIAQSAF